MDLAAVKSCAPWVALMAALPPAPARAGVSAIPIEYRYTAEGFAPDADVVRIERGWIAFLSREGIVLRRSDDFPETVWLTSTDNAGREWVKWARRMAVETPADPVSPPPAGGSVATPSDPARLRDACVRPPVEGPPVEVTDPGEAADRNLSPGPGAPAGEAWFRDGEGGRELRIRLPDGGRWIVRLEL